MYVHPFDPFSGAAQWMHDLSFAVHKPNVEVERVERVERMQVRYLLEEVHSLYDWMRLTSRICRYVRL
jgi:hypothetical protein